MADAMKWFTPYHAFATEGGRIGLVSCRLCGAALIVGDDNIDTFAKHVHWHGEQGDLDPDFGNDNWKSLHEQVARKATGMPQSECGLANLGPPYLGRCEELEPCSCEKLSFPHTRRCNRLLPCAGHSNAEGGE